MLNQIKEFYAKAKANSRNVEGKEPEGSIMV